MGLTNKGVYLIQYEIILYHEVLCVNSSMLRINSLSELLRK